MRKKELGISVLFTGGEAGRQNREEVVAENCNRQMPRGGGNFFALQGTSSIISKTRAEGLSPKGLADSKRGFPPLRYLHLQLHFQPLPLNNHDV